MDFFSSSPFVVAFLEKKGTKKLPHTRGGSLFDHLVRVGETLKEWGLDKTYVHAGYCHSIYSTQIFKESVTANRKEVSVLIGEDAEKLVYYFSVIDRPSLCVDDATYSFSNYRSKEKLHISKEEFIGLLHILLANDLDHIDRHSVSSKLSAFRPYKKFEDLLVEKAKDTLDELCGADATKNDVPYVEFIAHAGVRIVGENKSIITDPWIYPSTLIQPILFGLKPGMRTIDYPIPEPRVSMKEIASDIVLLSHMHTHHSPIREIREMALIQPITVVCPTLTEAELETIRKNIGDEAFSNITFILLDKDTELIFDEFSVKALTHPQINHFAYFIEHKKGSVLHISDALTKQGGGTEFDPVWNKFTKLRPTFMFVSAGSHAERTITKNNERDILEHSTFSPIQAAKLTRKVMPKHVGLIGMYNFSIWTNRLEYSLPGVVSEDAFFWALSYLAPGIKFHSLRPGDSFPLV